MCRGAAAGSHVLTHPGNGRGAWAAGGQKGGRAQLCGPRQQPGGLVRGSVRGRCGLPPSRQGSHTRPVLCRDRCDGSVGSRLHRARLDWRVQSRGCWLDEVRGDLGRGEQRAACKSSSRGGRLGPSATKQQDVERGSARLSLR